MMESGEKTEEGAAGEENMEGFKKSGGEAGGG
jgi:hypothetical protein